MTAAAIDYSTRTIKVYRGAYDAAARTAIAEHEADMLNPHGVTKLQVGLGNADNTSDAAKPVSNATAAALALKAPLASPALTGTPTAPTAPLGTVTEQVASTAFVQGAVNAADVPAVIADLEAHVANTNNPHATDAADVGLGNVANLAPSALPISDATQVAINAVDAAADAIAADLTAHKANVANPHATTKAQVGLAAADNTADLDKPISSATQAALNLKAPLASPALTGAPTAPTASPGTSTTQLATTAFVAAADAVVAGGAAAAQADADQALADAAAAQADATQALADAAAAQNAAEAAQSDADAAQAAADAAQADATQALADAAAAQAAADAAQASADEALGLIGQAAAVYGTSKTGAATAAELIDLTWIVTSASGQVVRVDAAVAADPQTVALVPAVPIMAGHTYTVTWRVQRQADPVDPINDSVTLGVTFLDSAYAATGSATVEDIALLVADGIEERTARLALAPFDDAAEVDHEAPPGTVYFRPWVDCYGDSHITDIVAIDGGGAGGGCCSAAIAGMWKTADNATEQAVETLIAAAAARPSHGNALLVQPAGALLSRTLDARARDTINIRDDVLGNNTVETSALEAFFAKVAGGWNPDSPTDPNLTGNERQGWIAGGKHRAAPGTIIHSAGYAWSLKGHGPISQLIDVGLQLDHNDAHVESLRLQGVGLAGIGVDIRAGAARLFDVEVYGKAIGITNRQSSLPGGTASNHTIIGGWLRDNTIGAQIAQPDYRAVAQRISGGSVGFDWFDHGGIELIGCHLSADTGPAFLVRGNHVQLRGDIVDGGLTITNITAVAGLYDSLAPGDVISGALFVEEDEVVLSSALAPNTRIVTVTPTTITLDRPVTETLTAALFVVNEVPTESYFIGNTVASNLTNALLYSIASIESANGGNSIKVNLTGEHILTKYMSRIELQSTGVAFYDDTTHKAWIEAVPSASSVQISFPFHGGLVTPATAKLRANDDSAQYLTTGPSAGQIRSLFTIGGNHNGTRWKGGSGYNYAMTRLKGRGYMHGFRPFHGDCTTADQIIRNIDIPTSEIRLGTHIALGTVLPPYTRVLEIIDATSIRIDRVPLLDRVGALFRSPEQPNNIFRIGVVDDQLTGGATVNRGSSRLRNFDPPLQGPGSLLGWAEINMFRNGTAAYDATEGSYMVGLRCPYTLGGMIDNEPAILNELGMMNRGFRMNTNGIQYDIQGTSFRVETGTLTFEENNTTLPGTGYFPLGLPVTTTTQARRSTNGALYPNAIHRWASPKKDTLEGASELAGYAVAPGEADILTRSFFLGCCTGDPVLTGNTAALRTLPSSIEVRSIGQVSLWKSGSEYVRFSSDLVSESFLRVDGDGPARFTVQNTNTTGPNTLASLGVRNQATLEGGVRMVASGAGFTNGGTPLPYLPADAGALVSGSLLSGGFSIIAAAGDMRFWAGPTPTLAMTIAAAGSIAFAVPIVQKPATSAIPANNGELTMSAASNTSVVIRLKGTDGIVRSGAFALA